MTKSNRDVNDLSNRKKAVRAEHAAAHRKAWSVRSHHRRCWWTWPLGHAYVEWRCAGCNKKLRRGL